MGGNKREDLFISIPGFHSLFLGVTVSIHVLGELILFRMEGGAGVQCWASWMNDRRVSTSMASERTPG